MPFSKTQMVDFLKKCRLAWSFIQRRMVHVNLQILYTCNFRCRICDFWHPPYSNSPGMTVGQIQTIATQLSRIGPQVISIGGGEPLMHPDLPEIIRILARDHFPVMICNGWFVTPALARTLFAEGIYEISISVDYASPEKHDAQRGIPGAFNRAIDALRILRENRVHPHQRVHMISVILEDNLDDVEELIRLSRNLGVTYLVTLYSDHRGRKAPHVSGHDISSRLLALKARYPEFVALRGYVGRFSEAVRRKGISPCHAGRNLMNIDTTGNVGFCIDTLEQSAGNILRDDVGGILANLARQRQRSTCNGCWTSCRGSIETLMYGKRKWASLMDYYHMTKDVPIGSQ
jgi:MoaA/NifB/PqqE/SkfB family radical SAM enzyme